MALKSAFYDVIALSSPTARSLRESLDDVSRTCICPGRGRTARLGQHAQCGRAPPGFYRGGGRCGWARRIVAGGCGAAGFVRSSVERAAPHSQSVRPVAKTLVFVRGGIEQTWPFEGGAGFLVRSRLQRSSDREWGGLRPKRVERCLQDAAARQPRLGHQSRQRPLRGGAGQRPRAVRRAPPA